VVERLAVGANLHLGLFAVGVDLCFIGHKLVVLLDGLYARDLPFAGFGLESGFYFSRQCV